MNRLVALLLAALAFAAAAQVPAPRPQRIALVIGNAAYRDAALPNPLNDAADMAKALEASGFTVIRRENASLRDMHLALREFGDALGRTSTGLFYFAGHGVQVRGRNYLLPVDADIAREDEVAFQALDLGAVMEKLDSARNPVNLVILDACRDNPFGKRLQASAKGLAQVDAPPGTLIAFATAPGSSAADGSGRNGLYTGRLLAEMGKPGITIEETLRNVRAAVRRDSKGAQVPWESTSLETEFVFRALPAKAAAAKPAAPPKDGGPPRSAIPPSAPPNFAPGDTWTYRYTNVLEKAERQTTMAVKEIQGAQVYWQDGAVGDLVGNMTRVKRGGDWRLYTPSTQMYVFPLNPGTRFTMTSVENLPDKTYDLEVTMAIGGEEDVATPAGTFRAIRIDRVVKWAQRDKPANAGVNTWVYWYSGAAKRFVAATQSNVAASGKQLQLDRWELESYKVR